MSGAQCTHLIGKGPSSEKYYDPSRQERETIAAPTDIHAISKERKTFHPDHEGQATLHFTAPK